MVRARQTVVLAAGAAVLLTVLGWATPGRIAFLLSVFAFSILSGAMLSTLSDKTSGGFEFLVALPVDRSVLAGARLAAGAVLALGAAVCLSAALWLVYPQSARGTAPLRVALEVYGGIGLVTVLGTSLAIGVSLRLRARHFANLFLFGLVAAFAVAELLKRIPPGARGEAVQLLSSSWLPRILPAAAVLLAVGTGWLAYSLARAGFERFEPERDRIDA